jgi:hypothetical protein
MWMCVHVDVCVCSFTTQLFNLYTTKCRVSPFTKILNLNVAVSQMPFALPGMLQLLSAA